MGRNCAQEEGDYKSGRRLKELYEKVREMNGRFMINVGPNPDGTIDPFEEKSGRGVWRVVIRGLRGLSYHFLFFL